MIPAAVCASSWSLFPQLQLLPQLYQECSSHCTHTHTHTPVKVRLKLAHGHRDLELVFGREADFNVAFEAAQGHELHASDKQNLEIALGPTGRRRDVWLTSKMEKEVSKETDALMRTVL